VLGALVQQGAQDHVVARFANVGCALVQRLGPQLVIRQPMGAHDAQGRELAMQTGDLVRLRFLHVENQHVGMSSGNGRADFFIPQGQFYRLEMLRETDHQRLRSIGVILVDDQLAWFHTFPLVSPFRAVAFGWDSKLLPQALSNPSWTALLAQRFLGRGLERFSLELSVLF